jgi:methylated-DNA-protein-cysteine methyltransferase related protein
MGRGANDPTSRRVPAARARASRRLPATAAVLPPPDPQGGSGTRRAGAGRWERIWAVVRRIPRGRVATYGQVAALAGLGRNARQAGYALHALPHGSPLPWHRVVNARGAISLPPMSGDDLTQRIRLEKEGVRFDARGRVDLERYGWRPGSARKRDV